MSLLRVGLLFLLFSQFLMGFGQTEIRGLLKDTASNKVLRAATVSVYLDNSSKVEKLTLSDEYGRFQLSGLPSYKKLRIEFSFLGYQNKAIQIELKKGDKKDLGVVVLKINSKEIDAIDILPPVSINGDTIEFNTDAFQLDTNAVVEDLLHKLPGIIVWGDGKITYKGKPLSNIIVNGKPFFGSDTKIALQNISKDAVKKIQVYNIMDKGLANVDPNYEMNVVLKDGKDKMLFGNLTSGLGTDNRYEANANLNYANRKLQATVGYATSNTNKNLLNLDQLLKNTTFKGVGIHADFDSDFFRPGLNREHVLANRIQYDFLGNKEVKNKNIITGSTFSRWIKSFVQDSSITVMNNNELVGSDNYSRSTTFDNTTSNHAANVEYLLSKDLQGRRLDLETTLDFLKSQATDQQDQLTVYALSSNHSQDLLRKHSENKDNSASWRFKLNLSKNQELSKPSGLSSFAHARYILGGGITFSDGNQLVLSQNKHTNLNAPSDNLYMDRSYNLNYKGNTHDIFLQILYKGFSWKNSVFHSVKSNNSQVLDQKDLNQPMINTALSYKADYKKLNYTPTLTYTIPLYDQSLMGRMYKRLELDLVLGWRLHREENHSTLTYRNISQSFSTPLPKIELSYDYSKSNSHQVKSTLKYYYEENYPTIDMLRPIYDDIVRSYRYFGGIQLEKNKQHSLNASVNYVEHQSYGWNASLSATYTLLQNGWADSIIFAPGQQQHYITNLDKDTRNYSTQLNITKPFILKNANTINLYLNSSWIWQNKFQYIDKLEQELNIYSRSFGASAYYNILNKFQAGLNTEVQSYTVNRRSVKESFYNSLALSSGLALNYAATTKLSLGTTGTLRLNRSEFDTDNALIWNANTIYRFLKGNNLHLKLAIYDILGQNRGIYFENGLTEFTTRYINNLTAYGMLSLSYFPRKFGL